MTMSQRELLLLVENIVFSGISALAFFMEWSYNDVAGKSAIFFAACKFWKTVS